MAITLPDPRKLSALTAVVSRANSKPTHHASADALHQRCTELEAENARLASRVTYLEALNQRDEADTEQRLSRYEERISELRAEIKRLKAQTAAPRTAPADTITVKEFARRHGLDLRTAYRRRESGRITRPDGSQGWTISGGGDDQDHYVIYADAIVIAPTPKAKKPKKASG